jgi:hypothetical protein
MFACGYLNDGFIVKFEPQPSIVEGIELEGIELEGIELEGIE